MVLFAPVTTLRAVSMTDPKDFWARDDQAETWTQAMALFQKGYDLQTQGLWADAMAHYRDVYKRQLVGRQFHSDRDLRARRGA